MTQFSLDYFIGVIPAIASGLRVTLQITVISTVFALIIGVFIAMITTYRVKVLYPLARLFVSFMRGTPAVAQLYFFYFGLAIYSTVIRNMTPIVACSVVLSLNVGAFMSESIRGALLSVDEGQKEAAASLGFSKLQTFWRIIVPQAVKVALPPLFNDMINLIKLSSLSFMIGVPDVMGQAKIAGASSFRYFEIYAAAMLVYWVVIMLLDVLSRYLQRKCEAAY